MGVLLAILVTGNFALKYLAQDFMSQRKLSLEELKNNPLRAYGEIQMALNPDLEIIGMDEASGIVRFRSRSTGEETEIAYRAGGNDFVLDTVQKEPGQKKNLPLPAWLSAYPDTETMGVLLGQSEESHSVRYTFETVDEPHAVAHFFSQHLETAGLTITEHRVQDDAAFLIAEEADGPRAFSLTMSGRGGVELRVTDKIPASK